MFISAVPGQSQVDEENNPVEAYHRHEVLLGGKSTCAKVTTSAQNLVVEEKQGEVGGSTNYKRPYSSETTIL